LAALLLAGIGLVYYDPRIQTFLAKKGAEILSKELKTQVRIKSIKIVDLHRLEISGLYVEDLKKDTLVSIGRLKMDALDYSHLDFKNHKILISDLDLDSTQFFLKEGVKNDLNLDFILNYFDSGKSGPSAPYLINITTLNIHQFHFRYKKEGTGKAQAGKINFEDVDLKPLDLSIANLSLDKGMVNGDFKSLSFQEKSGFILKNLKGRISMGSTFLKIKNLEIQTPGSLVRDEINFNFKTWKDFSDFSHKVNFKAHFIKSHVETDELAYFTDAFDKIHVKTALEGFVTGKLQNLHLNSIKLETGNTTVVTGNYIINNITESAKTYLETDNADIITNRTDLENFFKNIGEVHLMEQIPKELHDLTALHVEGGYKGTFHQFSTDIKVKSNLGAILAKVHFNKPLNGIPLYSGLVSTERFPLGKILDDPDFGDISFNSRISGRGFGKDIHLDTLESSFPFLHYKGRKIQNIYIQGSQHNKSFSGRINVNDPNLVLGFRGIIDLNSKVPDFNFKAEIQKADLRKLGIVSDSLVVKSNLNISFTGNSLSNLNGKILATNTHLIRGRKEFTLDSILVGAEKNGLEKNLFVRSCLLDADIRGRYDLKNLPIQFKELLGKYLPSTHWYSGKNISNQEFTSTILIKDLSPITSIFYPSLFISPDTRFYGNFNSKTQVLNLNGVFPEISLDNVHFQSVILDAENVEEGSLDINISTNSVLLDNNILTRSINIGSSLNRDSLKFNFKVEDVNSVNHLDLNGLIAINNTKGGLSILPSVLVLENKIWKIENSFQIGFEPGKTEINGFKISHDSQNPFINSESLEVNGIISSSPKDAVITRFHNFELSTLDQIVKQYGFTLSGRVNGEAQFSSVLDSLSFNSKVNIDSLAYSGSPLGDADIQTIWDGEHSNLVFKGSVKNKILNMIQLEGKIGLSKKNNIVEAILNMNHANAALLEPFTKGIVSHIRGTLSSKIKVSGTRDHPIINGSLGFNSTELTVDYLNTHYSINDSIEFTKSNIYLNKLKILDPYKHIATVEGNINLNQIDNPILADVNVHANNFLTLNTDDKQGYEYYGKAYSTGDYLFNGPINRINMEFDATTMPGTVLNIPLNRPNTANNNDFITFVSVKDSVHSALKKHLSHLGISLDFNLTITPDAYVKLIFDDKIGDVIRGTGNSDLNIQLTPLGDFLMYGDFEIEKGDYLFTSQNILNKLFTIEKGGSIRFSGDPLNADIDLFADYTARADVSPLYSAANVSSIYSLSNSTVQVNSIIHLSGTLSNPSFDFSLKFPLASYIEQDLSTYLNSKQVVTTQSMLFLISNQFNGNLTTQVGQGIALSTGIQFIGNQLTNLLNNFSQRLDINIRSLQDYGVVYRTFSNKLQFTGNLTNIANNQNNEITNLVPLSNNKLVGDAEASLLLNKKGTLKLKGFYREVPVDFLQPGNLLQGLNPPISYTQGIGLLYTRDFSSFHDLFGFGKKKDAPVETKKGKEPKKNQEKTGPQIEVRDIKQ